MANYTYKSSSADDIFGNVTLNLGDYNSVDTIDLGNMSSSVYDYSPSYSTISIGGAGGLGIGGGLGVTGAPSYTYSTAGANGTSGGLWGVSTSAAVDISTKGIDIKEGADIKVGGRSLSEFMDRVEARLGILQPKPELLEKYEALKQAYEHYKTLEALCMGDIPKRPDGK